MIDINTCTNCICLPVCLNKSENKLIWECSMLKDEIRNLSLHIVLDFEFHFRCNALNKVFFIEINEIDEDYTVIHVGVIGSKDSRRRFLFYFSGKIPEAWVHQCIV